MTAPRLPRCYCGHPIDTHRHYRRGSDCGACGDRCPRYAPRDRPLPESHRLVAAMSDAHAMGNLAHLIQFGVSTRPLPLVPAQRTRSVLDDLAARRAHHAALERRRPR